MTTTRRQLEPWGWDAFFEESFREHGGQGRIPARVGREDRGMYLLLSADGELAGEVPGRFRHRADSKHEYPAVGDWVAVEALPGGGRATIHAVLPRRSLFLRKVAGARTEGQVLAANVDTAFIVNGLDGGRNLNLRRTERYLTLASESGATPVVLLNKADVASDVAACVREVEAVAGGVPVRPVSAITGEGLDRVRAHLAPGRTAVFLGSSGVGKSALINALLGIERQTVNTLRRRDLQGRHTTICRELIALPDGALVIDTPGMREAQLWGDGDSVAQAFGDIEDLAGQCRFRDCRHEREPGCAIRRAIEEGVLDASRLESYLRLQQEVARLAARQDQRTRSAEKARRREHVQGSRRVLRGE